jgi:glycosyltransferase involved in cell wall biosynthesis
MSFDLSLSIAMATYNGAHFIEEQLNSLTTQTSLPNELVITDDASTDETLDIIRTFAKTAPFPVRIEKNPEKLGFRGNFLKAAKLCQSEVIAFCDQDDVWLPNKLETCLPHFKDQELLLVYHNALVVTETLQPIATLQDRAAPSRVNPPLSMNPWQHGLGFTQLFRRSLLEFSDYWPQSLDYFNAEHREAHDQWVSFLASCLGSTHYINQPLVLYRQHEGNVFGWNRKEHSIKGKYENLFSSAIPGLRQYELSAKQRISILEQMGTALSGLNQVLARNAKVRFQAMLELYRQRQEIYQSPHLPIRFYRFLNAILAGLYRPKEHWGVGYKAMIRDLLRGVLLPIKNEPGVEEAPTQ